MINDYDTNEVWLSPWLDREFPDIFAGLTEILKKHNVACETITGTNDLWCRDYMPIQIDDNRFVCYTYRPDYLLKKRSDAKYITDSRKVCERLGLNAKYTDIVIDGGNVVKAGNHIIMTEKVFAENPQYDRKSLIDELENLFECELLFLPWDKAEKYGHSDGIVKAISEDTVLMTNYANFDRDMAVEMERRLSAVFNVERLLYNCSKVDSRSWAYINFLTVGSLIVLPKLNTECDEQALAQIKSYYPDYTIVQLDITRSVAAGGGLNCITWCIKQ
ncbi:MAG: agmatine deiminase family protein [Alistipes sp.]|nr:agmatine deiminase family protein [Alistipes sp.]